MLAYHHRSASLSFISTDLPILSTLETVATLYQKEQEKFHVLLRQCSPAEVYPQVEEEAIARTSQENTLNSPSQNNHSLIWLEISPFRVIMTMQGDGKLSYRHFWEQGIYGSSRYWLNCYPQPASGCLRLRNFTQSLRLEGYPLPQRVRVEYNLWSEKLYFGHYIINLEIFD